MKIVRYLYDNKVKAGLLIDNTQIIAIDDIDLKINNNLNSHEKYVIQRLKVKTFRNHLSFTDQDEEYVKTVLEKYSEGIIPKNISRRIKQKIEKITDPFKILSIIKAEIPNKFLEYNRNYNFRDFSSKTEVILSEWLEQERIK